MILRRLVLLKIFECARARYGRRSIDMVLSTDFCTASEDDSLSYERLLGKGGGGEVYMVCQSKHLNNVFS